MEPFFKWYHIFGILYNEENKGQFRPLSHDQFFLRLKVEIRKAYVKDGEEAN